MHKLLGCPRQRIDIASLHPGDLIVVHPPSHTNGDHITHTGELLNERSPSAVNCCLMVGEDVRIEINGVVNPADRPLQR